MDRFHVVKELAPALFGSIVLCVDKNNGNHVAIKRMQLAAAAKRQANGGPTVQEDLHVEKRVYRHVNKMGGHRNILRLLSSFEEAGHEHFVLEYCHQGDLFTILQSSPHQRLQASQALHYMRQICHGLAFLHSHEIAHGDISLENVLVDANDVAKLMDFGLAVESFHVTQPSSAVGKFFYMPPEMYLGSPYDASKADMWSLGILLLILHTGMPPFARAHSSDNVYASYLKYDIRTLLKGWNVLPHLPVDALDLVERLVVATPDKRLSISDVRTHKCCRSSCVFTVVRRCSDTRTLPNTKHCSVTTIRCQVCSLPRTNSNTTSRPRRIQHQRTRRRRAVCTGSSRRCSGRRRRRTSRGSSARRSRP
ncbi:serine/threonine protein kinase [Aphanomyces invadans]|uniref:Serine/threonine protein kinase n=1 Tax=Aphanomyces invadans TaxID=157072 RepID=A0A024T933_9STRA|nr:serine/threonine protein kinase [Aphanomyces invadans]ETV90489.1 serine/threonine protein kinase [Aphanomyces invadans]|eukprot:XP_008880877.1 serine/threonine protein kinase [Aphanomyces invadans]